MTIKWKISALLGFIAALGTYFFSYTNNTLVMSLFWAVIGFLLFFLAGTLFQTMLQYLNKGNTTKNMDSKPVQAPIKREERQSPDVSEEAEFLGIPLTDLHQSGEMQNSEKIANTIRSWTE